MPTNKEIFNAAMNAEVDSLNSKTGGSTKLKVGQLADETDTITPLNADTLTVDPTTSQQDFAPTAPKNGFESVTVNAISPIKTAADLAASGKTVTVPVGYYASQATKDVADGSVTIPNTSITANPSIVVNTSTGVITSTVSGSGNITPTVSAGYVSSVSGATASVSGSSNLSLTTQAAATITPTSSAQTAVATNKYTLGAVDVEAVVCTNLSAGNIKDGVIVKIGTATDDDSVTSVTGSYQGGGSYTKPSYLISDGDSVSNFYFNTEYTPSASFFSGLPYDQQDTYFDYTYLALGYLLAIDLSTVPNAGLTGYCLFWGDPNSPAIIYSTTTFDLSSVMAGMVVTTAGWQMSSLTPASAATMNVSTSNADFVGIMDELIANDDVAFGSHGGGSLPQLNAPTQIQINGTQLTITPNTNNGNFADGYKIFVDNVQTYTTTSTSYDLSGISANQATITVKAYGVNFQDSPASAGATYLHQYTVSFYDGSSQMTGSPVTVAYGSTISQAITTGGIDTMKSGYEFDGWYSDNSLTIEVSISTVVSSNITIYGKWTEGISFARSPWSDIVDICDAGQASTTFAIGDTRDVVGSNNNTYRLRIIDFGHDDLSNNQGKASMSIQISTMFVNTEYMYVSLLGISSTFTPAQAEFTSSTPVTIKNGVYAVLDALPSEIGQSAKSVTKKVAYNSTYKTDDFIAFPLSPYEIAVSPKFSNGSYTNDGTIYEYYKNNSFPTISGNSSKYHFRGLGNYGSAIAHSYYQVSDGTFRLTNSNTQSRSASMPIVFCI